MKIIEHVENALDYAGIIPYFFRDAPSKIKTVEKPTLDDVASAMDDLYGYGGFRFPFGGTVDISRGVYVSPCDDDPPLSVLLTMEHAGFTLHVFPYAITALTDADGNQRVARID